ncbi:radical SAM protein [Massilia glaciei]|uniref:Radical SAM protein n=1 Tax=Massilia glaciei TaxID=1524097 RepID=A0A2U2HIE7_9BURK|nr:radical SAM protein [Massilia glaciei]
MIPGADKVLVVTGGLLNEKETSVIRAARKQLLQWRAAESAWLDLKIKLVMAESLVCAEVARRMAGRNLPEKVSAYFNRAASQTGTPELTEVVLTTLLRQEQMPYATATVDEVFGQSPSFRQQLAECNTVFLSATLLRDLSEVVPLLKLLKTPHNRIVLGGALANLLADEWPGVPEVDLLAAGYGELLVPALVRYIRSGFTDLVAPPTGRIERRAHTRVVRSGVPDSRDLDFLPTPDWAQAERDYGRRFDMLYYESVRGCPYRCNFCNYPYLFDDTRFRYKSAQKIADDWQRYTEDTGAKYITCLDSLFTMPRARLSALCNELVRRRIDVKWICYARADDIAHEDIVRMMREAGAHQVQIGIESGDQQQLDNMDKRCTVEANHRALENCRKLGLTSIISLIVGFPGETAQTLEHTYRFLEATPPDFYFLATFSTRVANVPILSEKNRRRFGLRTDNNPNTVAPYWEHDTMSSATVGNHVRALNERLMQNRIALNAPMFYSGMLGYDIAQREALLAFQHGAATGHGVLKGGFDLANRWLDRKLARSIEKNRLAWPENASAHTSVLTEFSGPDSTKLRNPIALHRIAPEKP